MNNLAVVYQHVGQSNEALSLQSIAEMMKKVLGSEHPKTLNSMNNLAGFYRVAGQIDRALHLYQQTLSDEDQSGPGTPQSINSMYGLARTTAIQASM